MEQIPYLKSLFDLGLIPLDDWTQLKKLCIDALMSGNLDFVTSGAPPPQVNLSQYLGTTPTPTEQADPLQQILDEEEMQRRFEVFAR